MEMLIHTAVKAAAYALLLWLLSRYVDGFEIFPASLVAVTLVLVITEFFLSRVLGFLALPFKVVTLGLLNFIINFLINIVIFKVTDKFSERMKIHSTSALLLAAGALSLTNWLIRTAWK